MQFIGNINDFQCIQTQTGFTHYITVKKNNNNKYDIEFYAYEVLGPTPSIYVEFTELKNDNLFNVTRWIITDPQSINNTTIKYPFSLSFKTKEIEVSCRQQDGFEYYKYGNLNRKIGAILYGTNEDINTREYGFINSNGDCEIVRKDSIYNNSPSIQYNIMHIESTDPNTPITKENDQWKTDDNNKKKGEVESGEGPWKIGNDYLSSKVDIYYIYSLRMNNTYAQKAYYITSTDIEQSSNNLKLKNELKTIDNTQAEFEAKINTIKENATNNSIFNANFSNEQIQRIKTGVAKVLPDYFA